MPSHPVWRWNELRYFCYKQHEITTSFIVQFIYHEKQRFSILVCVHFQVVKNWTCFKSKEAFYLGNIKLFSFSEESVRNLAPFHLINGVSTKHNNNNNVTTTLVLLLFVWSREIATTIRIRIVGRGGGGWGEHLLQSLLTFSL